MANKEFYLVDTSRNKEHIKQMRMCEVASLIAMYHNGPNTIRKLENCDDLVRKYWKWDKYPPCSAIVRKYISVANIKWFIRNHFVQEDKGVWNIDFIFGITKCGRVLPNKIRLPSFEWWSYFNVVELLASSPYSGTFSHSCFVPKSNNNRKWKFVTALLLPYSENSESFLAGILATGQVKTQGDSTVVYYSHRVEKYFVKFGIPIESREESHVIISPVWPALFSIYMPDICKKNFLYLKRPLLSEVYCPILWKAYISTDFISDGIPYLRSRRSILYDHKCEEGAFEKLDRLRIDMNLTILDNVIINCIKRWGKYVCHNPQAS